jgi:uncharacterized membrane protein
MAGIPMRTQFWGDEYLSLHVAMSKTLSEAVSRIPTIEGSGPLFDLLLWFWFRIVPYGDKWLLLLPTIFAALSIFATGMAAREMLGGVGGAAAAMLMLMCNSYINYGNELRTYTLTVFASALLLWVYLRRLKSAGNEKPRNLALYGLLTALLVYTHYCAFFICFILFLFDIVYIVKKQMQKRVIFAYAGATLLFAPWFLYYTTTRTASPFQRYVPTLPELFILGKTLLNNNLLFVFVFALALCTLVVDIWIAKKRPTIHMRAAFICIVTTCGFVLLMYVASLILTKALNMGNFWVFRYFLVVLPFLFFPIAELFCGVTNLLVRLVQTKLYVAHIVLAALVMFYLPQSYIELKAHPSSTYTYDWLESAAEWLYAQQDIYLRTVAVVLRPYDDDWMEYTVGQMGRRDLFSYVNALNNDTLQGINKLYTIDTHVPIDFSQTILAEQFEQVSGNESLRIKIWERKKQEIS